MVRDIVDFIHEYDFPYHDYLLTYKEDILTHYFHYKSQDSTLTDFVYKNKDLSSFLFPKLNKIVEDNYWGDKHITNNPLRIYIQDNSTPHPLNFQHHAYGISSLVGVFYLDLPKNGGDLQFLNVENESIFTLKLQKNKLYTFPSWLPHKPIPQEDNTPRVCFNWHYACNTRLIHKINTNIIY